LEGRESSRARQTMTWRRWRTVIPRSRAAATQGVRRPYCMARRSFDRHKQRFPVTFLTLARPPTIHAPFAGGCSSCEPWAVPRPGFPPHKPPTTWPARWIHSHEFFCLSTHTSDPTIPTSFRRAKTDPVSCAPLKLFLTIFLRSRNSSSAVTGLPISECVTSGETSTRQSRHNRDRSLIGWHWRD